MFSTFMIIFFFQTLLVLVICLAILLLIAAFIETSGNVMLCNHYSAICMFKKSKDIAIHFDFHYTHFDCLDLIFTKTSKYLLKFQNIAGDLSRGDL